MTVTWLGVMFVDVDDNLQAVSLTAARIEKAINVTKCYSGKPKHTQSSDEVQPDSVEVNKLF